MFGMIWTDIVKQPWFTPLAVATLALMGVAITSATTATVTILTQYITGRRERISAIKKQKLDAYIGVLESAKELDEISIESDLEESRFNRLSEASQKIANKIPKLEEESPELEQAARELQQIAERLERYKTKDGEENPLIKLMIRKTKALRSLNHWQLMADIHCSKDGSNAVRFYNSKSHDEKNGEIYSIMTELISQDIQTHKKLKPNYKLTYISRETPEVPAGIEEGSTGKAAIEDETKDTE